MKILLTGISLSSYTHGTCLDPYQCLHGFASTYDC